MTRTENQAIEAAAAQGALPAISADMMVAALDAYRDLQHKLDKSMPEQIMNLDGKPFRKKGYWRAVALAFNLNVEPEKEERSVSGKFKDGRDNFGYLVTYRATHPSGRTQTGDGACFSIEKARRFKCPHPEAPGSRRTVHFPHNTCPDFDPDFSWRALPGEATEHNVRSHAHTRAYNRAVSNLVGFGEVSAEEVESSQDDQASHAEPQKAGSGRTEAAQSQASTTSGTSSQGTQASAQATPGTTTVKMVTKKPGKTNNKAWTRFFVVFDDGRDGVTFDVTLGEALEAASKATPKTLVNPEIEKGARGNDLKRLLTILQPEPAPQPDEPVSGPEKILTIRKVETDLGTRWIIQTDKRQLVTDVEQHAKDAVEARKNGAGIVPAFEVVAAKTAGGHPANKLTSFTVENVETREPGQDG